MRYGKKNNKNKRKDKRKKYKKYTAYYSDYEAYLCFSCAIEIYKKPEDIKFKKTNKIYTCIKCKQKIRK